MHSAFGPASPQAHVIAVLWWWMLAIGGVIWLSVAAFAISVAIRRRRADAMRAVIGDDSARDPRAHRAIAAAGLGTVLVLAAFLVYDFGVGRALAQHPQQGITIDVTGHQWWWEFQYKDPDPSKWFTTANEIRVPVGRSVQLRLQSSDVIHSLWIPS